VSDVSLPERLINSCTSMESRTTNCDESLQTEEGAMSSDSDGDSIRPSLKDRLSEKEQFAHSPEDSTALLLSALRIDTRNHIFI
jgi:hypothetical protein